jgi:hypothetical protein
MGINYSQPRVSMLDEQVDTLDEHYIEGGNQKGVYAMYKQNITQNWRRVLDNIIRSLGIKIHVAIQEQPSLLTKVQSNKFVTKIQ